MLSGDKVDGRRGLPLLTAFTRVSTAVSVGMRRGCPTQVSLSVVAMIRNTYLSQKLPLHMAWFFFPPAMVVATVCSGHLDPALTAGCWSCGPVGRVSVTVKLRRVCETLSHVHTHWGTRGGRNDLGIPWTVPGGAVSLSRAGCRDPLERGIHANAPVP